MIRRIRVVLLLVGFFTYGISGVSAATIDEGVVSGDFSGAITVDGVLTDWGVTVNSSHYDPGNTSWLPTQSGVAYWIEDDATGTVGPGGGGQNFDVEAAYGASSGFNGGHLYAAFVSGTDRAGEFGWNDSQFVRTGDWFFDLNPDGSHSWDFALALSSRDGLVEGHAYKPVSGTWFTDPTDFGASRPGMLTGSLTDITALLSVDYMYAEGMTGEDIYASNDPSKYGDADHNVAELALGGTGLINVFGATDSVLMHYTQECGNDVFDMQSNINLFGMEGDINVPEPGTAILAIGALVAGAYARRRKRKTATAADPAE